MRTPSLSGGAFFATMSIATFARYRFVPIPTVAPLVTVTAAPIEVLEPVKLQTNGILRIAAYVLGGLFAASFLLFVIHICSAACKCQHQYYYDRNDPFLSAALLPLRLLI